MNDHNYEYQKEILEYDGYVLSVEYEDAYMLMNNDSITNHEEVEEGKQIAFDVETGFVVEAMVLTQ